MEDQVGRFEHPLQTKCIRVIPDVVLCIERVRQVQDHLMAAIFTLVIIIIAVLGEEFQKQATQILLMRLLHEND